MSPGKYKLTVELGYVGGKRKKKNKTVAAKNDTEAKKKLVLFEAKVLSGNLIDSTNMTLEGFYPEWKEKYAVDHYGEKTLKETEKIIEKRILPAFGSSKMVDIKKIHVVDYFSDLKKDGKRLDGKKGKLSPSTLDNIYKAFNSIMKVAVEWELIPSNPCASVKLPPIKHKKADVYTVEETKKLFDLLEKEDPIWQLIVQSAAVLGAREVEIAALEGKHLDFTDNSITIEQAFVVIEGKGLVLKSTKTDQTRKISVPADLMRALKKLRLIKLEQQMEMKNLWKWEDHLFLFSDEYGQPYRPDSISHVGQDFSIKNQ